MRCADVVAFNKPTILKDSPMKPAGSNAQAAICVDGEVAYRVFDFTPSFHAYQRSLSDASAVSTRTMQTIQKRTVTFGSATPLNSK